MTPIHDLNGLIRKKGKGAEIRLTLLRIVAKFARFVLCLGKHL